MPFTQLRAAACVSALLGGAAFLLPCSEAQAASSRQQTAKNSAKNSAKESAKPAAEDEVFYGGRSDVVAYAEEVARTQGLDAEWTRDVLAQSKFIPSVARAIMPPPAGTAKNWAAYRARFIEPKRVRAGLQFWQTHATVLERAQSQTGVPAEIIVGIIGVETLYGAHTGRYRVIDALATLSFDFPEGRKNRSAFFRDELSAFLKLCHSAGLDPLGVKGSYAGAMGLPQFMPSSLLSDGLDFDDDKRIDLLSSPADAIGSVANFLQRRGWKPGLATHYPVAAPVDVSNRARLLAPDITPTFSVEEFEALGAALRAQDKAALQAAGKLALVELQNGEAAPSYVAGTPNFYVLTRYNWSSYYAMAVIELGQTISALRLAETARRDSPPDRQTSAPKPHPSP